MTLSDKVRRVAFTLTVGSIGAGIGYIANDGVNFIVEVRKEAAAKEEAKTHREYMERLNQYVPSPSVNYLVHIIKEMRQESAVKENAHRKYTERPNQYVPSKLIDRQPQDSDEDIVISVEGGGLGGGAIW